MTIEELINELRREPNTQREVYVEFSSHEGDDYYGKITKVGINPYDGQYWIYGEQSSLID